ncbi:MAG TPA: MoaD/ThiS family protein [Gemmatimonadales bacterium]|nr:MoaD/ThiS family protein [Gemmatimonadales bacterium]
MTTSIPAVLTVRVLLFARYAELLGCERLDLRVPAARGAGRVTAADVVAALRARPGGERLPARPLLAVNLRQQPLETVLAEGDEVALLPPLAGG